MKRMLTLFCCLLFAAMLLTSPQEVTLGIRSGATLWFDLLLPSLFPFMILASLLSRSGAGELLTLPLRPLTRLLRLPDYTSLVLLTSMVGGFPAGAQTISSLVASKRLSCDEAAKLLFCAVNAGPAFIVIAVGERMFHSTSLGWRLLLAQTVSSLLLCLFFCRQSATAMRRPLHQSPPPPFANALVDSVAQATGGILAIGSYVLLVSVLLTLCQALPLSPVLHSLLAGLLEVTTGCASAATLSGRIGVCLAAFFLSFGGLSVCLQVLALVLPMHISVKGFFAARVLGGILSAGAILLLLLLLPPVTQQAMACISPALLPAAHSPNRLLGAFCMMAMTVQLLLCIDRCASASK